MSTARRDWRDAQTFTQSTRSSHHRPLSAPITRPCTDAGGGAVRVPPVGKLLPPHRPPPHQGLQDVQEPKELHHHQAGANRALAQTGAYPTLPSGIGRISVTVHDVLCDRGVGATGGYFLPAIVWA